MTEVSITTEHDSSKQETQLPNACFSAMIGLLCFALQIFVRNGL